MNISTRRLKLNFSKAAADYDTRAHFQQVETRRVLDAALMLLPKAGRVLDIGCGTGYFAQLAKPHRPDWQILGLDISSGMCVIAKNHSDVIQSDAKALPFAEYSVDMCISSLCLQWVVDKEQAFREIRRVLKPGGRVIISTLGCETLKELRKVAREAELTLGLLAMDDEQTYRIAAEKAGLDVTMFTRQSVPEYYPSLSALFDSMRLIGAGNNFEGRSGLTGARRWKKMVSAYETLRTHQGLPATWDKYFMVLRKASA